MDISKNDFMLLGSAKIEVGEHIVSISSGLPADGRGYQNLRAIYLVPQVTNALRDGFGTIHDIVEDASNHQAELPEDVSATSIIRISAVDASMVTEGWDRLPDATLGTAYAKNPDATVAYLVQVPRDGTYEIMASVRWDGARGSLQYRADDGSWSVPVMPLLGRPGSSTQTARHGIMSLGTTTLSAGEHTITFRNTRPVLGSGFQNLEWFALLSTDGGVGDTGTVEIEAVKHSPVHYAVTIDAAGSMSSYLILSESFHPQWKLYSGTVNWWQALFREPLPESRHLKANTYANAWVLDAKEGAAHLTIYFLPQSYFYVGLCILAMFLGGTGAFLGFGYGIKWLRDRERVVSRSVTLDT